MRTPSTYTARRASTTAACAVLGIYVVISLLGCAQLFPNSSQGGFQFNNPLDGLGFGTQNVSTTSTEEVMGEDGSSIEKTPFFDVPADWKVIDFSEESLVYRLQHRDIAESSLVVTYRELAKDGSESERRTQLREQHTKLIERFPESFEQLEYREWKVDDRPHIRTTLRGRKAPEQPLLVIDGYSVGIGPDSYVVFAAIPDESFSDRRADVRVLSDSLRPVQVPADAEPAETTDFVPPADAGEEAPADTDAPAEEAPVEDAPKEVAPDTL